MTDTHQDDIQSVEQATRMTVMGIEKILEDNTNIALSKLTIAERDELIQEVARIMPAGNVVNFVLNGILSARERERTPDDSSLGRSHLNALFKGLSFMRNNVLYQVAFAGPATVLAGYNLLLQIAGAKPDDFLPNGAWQFYVEFGLREDAARHQNETVAFQSSAQQIQATNADQLTAWTAACMWLLQNYEPLLAQIWEESVRLHAIETHTNLTGLHRKWQSVRPFGTPGLKQDLVIYRQEQFDQFCNAYLSQVSKKEWKQYADAWYNPEQQDERGRRQREYVRQMSLHRHLEPGEYSDQPHPIQSDKRRLAIVHNGNYYLLKPINPSNQASLSLLRQQIDAILQTATDQKTDVDQFLIKVPRDAQQRARAALQPATRNELERLRTAPIIINWDQIKRQTPLSQIRAGQRGIGDHGLTLFHTSGSTVFDFSHIFFDGTWAMATAEILTNEAMKNLHRLSQVPVTHRDLPAIQPLSLQISDKSQQTIQRMQSDRPDTISGEVRRPITPLHKARKVFKARTSIHLTVNDLLMLYRTIFNQCYTPSKRLLKDLKRVSSRSQVRQIQSMWKTNRRVNPSMLIPLDASRYDPKERIFPSTFRSPLPDFKTEHEDIVALLQQYDHQRSNWQAFQRARENYLAYISAFSAVTARYREIAISGESMSNTAIKLIAGLPQAMQQIADEIPGSFSIVNEAIKGEEVFSNVGRVVDGSSLTRFASAKDDNDKKVLVWGIMTDSTDHLYVTLRDFRPPVLELSEAGHADVAQHITQDFLSAYIEGLYRFSAQLRAIVTAKH